MVQYPLIEHSELPKCIKHTYPHIVNTLIEHSNNKIFTSVLFTLVRNTSIMGSMNIITGKNFGKFPEKYWANL